MKNAYLQNKRTNADYSTHKNKNYRYASLLCHFANRANDASPVPHFYLAFFNLSLIVHLCCRPVRTIVKDNCTLKE